MTHEEVLDEVNVIYEIISQHSKDYDSAWSDGNYTEALEILIDYYEGGLIEELEKIKAEIEEIKGDSLEYNASDYLYGRYQAFDITVDILEDRISELKGE